jgi:ubiquinone/menaquinone biosynthesis C-methylase UbiE
LKDREAKVNHNSKNTRGLDVENKVRKFYEEHGWKADASGTFCDTALFVDLRSSAKAYKSATRRRVLEHLPKNGNLFLDAGSGPVQYPEYVEYSAGFSKRICVDLSQEALKYAAQKLGSHGEYVQSSILELPFPDNHFDAVVSLHAIYHVDAQQQEMAVRQLVRVAKPSHPIVIVYTNPNNVFRLFLKALPSNLKRRLKSSRDKDDSLESSLYFHPHPLGWWKRFSDQCSVTILPFAMLPTPVSTFLMPDNWLGRLMFRGVLAFERSFPQLATVLGNYPLIVLNKKS